jgi:hypothetical protein
LSRLNSADGLGQSPTNRFRRGDKDMRVMSPKKGSAWSLPSHAVVHSTQSAAAVSQMVSEGTHEHKVLARGLIDLE